MMSATEDPAVTLPHPESDALAQRWMQRLERAKDQWSIWHKRMAHNQDLVAGFDVAQDPASSEFCRLRANLIFSTIAAILPNIYARDPEISVTSRYPQQRLSLFCHTLQTVINRALLDANLKDRAKDAVSSAMTCYFGIVKVMYQREAQSDPMMAARLHDSETHSSQLTPLHQDMHDPAASMDQEAQQEEHAQLVDSMQSHTDVSHAEGLVIDLVSADHLLIDPDIKEFCNVYQAGWMAQRIPMNRQEAQARYGIDLRGATPYNQPFDQANSSRDRRLASCTPTLEEDQQICVIEVWDRRTDRVYTLVEGCPFFVREPWTPPRVGARWYPFFILPFSTVVGKIIGPCLVDLTEKLQNEHNDTRDKFAAHRHANRPHWIVSTDTAPETIQRHTQATLGEIVLVQSNGLPIQQVIQPGQNIPIHPADYDTSPIRQDWEQVTGLQDASRSMIAQAKTATEAALMDKALTGRVSEFLDKLKGWLQQIAQYVAQMLLQELTPQQVQRYMGPPIMTTRIIEGRSIVEEQPSYDWPELSKAQVFDMVQVKIRAGTNGAPDTLEKQKAWMELLPKIMPLIEQLMQLRAKGEEAAPLEALLRIIVKVFDENEDVDVETLIPKMAQPPKPEGPVENGLGLGMTAA